MKFLGTLLHVLDRLLFWSLTVTGGSLLMLFAVGAINDELEGRNRQRAGDQQMQGPQDWSPVPLDHDRDPRPRIERRPTTAVV